MNFKIGDKVKCIEPFEPYLTLTKEYQVVAFSTVVQVLDDTNTLKWFYPKRFELVTDHHIHISEHNPFNYKLCNHDWFDYLGLNESFTFCKKCDVRK